MTTEQLTEWLAERGPLLVEEARFDDPVLRLGGRGWGLTINASWRVLAADRTFAFSGGMVDERGYIKVNDDLSTSVSGIYALGDCNGKGAFTHMSMYQARIATDHILGRECAQGTFHF